jgi:hypothetical protein
VKSTGFFIYLAWGFHCKSIFGYYFQGPGCISKHEKCGYAKMKNSYKIAEKLEMVHTMYEGNAFRVHVRVICSSGWTQK